MTTSPSPQPHDGHSVASLAAPRQLVVVAVAAAFSLVLFVALSTLGARPAGASEFTPDPAASISSACSAANLGTDITVTMTNEHGLADAHFTVDSFAYGSTSHVVAPGATEQFVIDGVPDGHTIALTVTGDYGVVAQQSVDTDCWSYTGDIVPSCVGDQAQLDVHVVRTGELAGNVYLDTDEGTVASAWVDDSWDHTLPVASDVPVHAVVGDNHDGTIAVFDGTVTCAVPATTVPSTTVPTPTTTVPDPVVPSTEPPVVLSADGQLAGELPAPATAELDPTTAPASLAFTGGETGWLAALGAVLLVAGLISWSSARRRRAQSSGA